MTNEEVDGGDHQADDRDRKSNFEKVPESKFVAVLVNVE